MDVSVDSFYVTRCSVKLQVLDESFLHVLYEFFIYSMQR